MASALHHPHVHAVSALALLASLTACAGVSNSNNAPTTGRVIPFERIQASGARNAWEALQLTVPHLKFQNFGTAPAAVSTNRGRTSIMLNNQPLIFIDERRVFDLNQLRRLPVSAVNSIHILSSIEGTTRYGTNAANGVIVIRTRQT